MPPALKQLPIPSRVDTPPVIWLTGYVAGAGVHAQHACPRAQASSPRVLELYGVLPSGHSPSSGLPLIGLPSLKWLHLGGTGKSILAMLKSLNLSESLQVFAMLLNTVTEDGPCSRWLIKLRGRQGIVPDHTHSVY